MAGFLVHNDEIRRQMLEEINCSSIEELFADIHSGIRLRESLDLPNALSELEAKQKLQNLAKKNSSTGDFAYFMGGGIYNKFIPSCISNITSRSEFQTAYTPYQPEISQGTLQSIYEYQTMICNLTGMDVSNAGVYDGATACAEALLMACRVKKRTKVLVADSINPQYAEVIKTYTTAGDIEADFIPLNSTKINTDCLNCLDEDYACILVQYPNYFGSIEDMQKINEIAKEKNILFIVCADPSMLSVLTSPSELGADIAVGDIQTLGIPMNLGGPSAGFMAVKKEYMRQLPGRIVGMTKDKDEKRAYTLTQQAREQHIRRDKATSNICSNQALMCLSATIYLSVVGAKGLREISQNAIEKAHLLAKKLSQIEEVEVLNEAFLNEFTLKLPDSINAKEFLAMLETKNIFGGIYLGDEFKQFKNCILIALTELNTVDDIYKYISELKSK